MSQNETRIPIETPVGNLNGRDAIYTDMLIHSQCPSILEAEGEFAANLCSSYEGDNKWIKFKISFFQVLFFNGWEIEFYPYEKRIVSSFDFIENSELLDGFGEHQKKHFVFSTYDYIYEIIAANYKIVLGEERK